MTIFERVAKRAQDSGMSVTAEGVREIDRLLGEERDRIAREGQLRIVDRVWMPPRKLDISPAPA